MKEGQTRDAICTLLKQQAKPPGTAFLPSSVAL